MGTLTCEKNGINANRDENLINRSRKVITDSWAIKGSS
jgi:hypothetical protein